ncbi:MAG: protein kinase, partial [Acidobacteria bacterium]|nr:protein kinase [Acidobacteriota bacterium]
YGSPRYVSPEQAQGLPVDQRSDIYSLGVILYEMLAGQPPFGNDDDKLKRTEILRAQVEREPRPPSSRNAGCAPEVEAIIMRALEKDPEKRFQTAAEFLRAVRLARARDAGDVIEEAQTAVEAFHPVGTYELDTEADQTVRQSYNTQPIHGLTCANCGTDADSDEGKCRVCGAQLGSSPSTARLARIDSTAQGGARGRWAVVALIIIGIVTGALIYLSLSRESRRRAAEKRTPNANAREGATLPSSSMSPLPPTALVALKPARVVVDSSFDGYDGKPLTDGVTDVRRVAAMRYNEGNWASAETPDAHWIELQLDQPAAVAAVYVYWGFDKNRYLPSRRAELQAADERGEWRTVSTVEPGANYDRTSFEFAPVRTSRLRLLQPAQHGPPNRSFIMWVREVQVFAAKE